MLIRIQTSLRPPPFTEKREVQLVIRNMTFDSILKTVLKQQQQLRLVAEQEMKTRSEDRFEATATIKFGCRAGDENQKSLKMCLCLQVSKYKLG